MIGTSSRNDEGKSRKLNTLPNGKCVVGNGISAAQDIIVVLADDSMTSVLLDVLVLVCRRKP